MCTWINLSHIQENNTDNYPYLTFGNSFPKVYDAVTKVCKVKKSYLVLMWEWKFDHQYVLQSK